jgi:hypothetical protein
VFSRVNIEYCHGVVLIRNLKRGATDKVKGATLLIYKEEMTIQRAVSVLNNKSPVPAYPEQSLP